MHYLRSIQSVGGIFEVCVNARAMHDAAVGQALCQVAYPNHRTKPMHQSEHPVCSTWQTCMRCFDGTLISRNQCSKVLRRHRLSV